MLALRPYTPLRMVLTVCGACFSDDPDRPIDYETDILQGNLIAMDGAVYLRRYCRRGHGEVTSLYEEDYALWDYLQQWRTPTREIVPDSPATSVRSRWATRRTGRSPDPALLRPAPRHHRELQPGVPDLLRGERRRASGVSPGSRTSSGRSIRQSSARAAGSTSSCCPAASRPSTPRSLEIIEAATSRAVTRVILNTNGIRIVRDDRFLAALGELRNRVEVYLQFDGFEAASTPLPPWRGPARAEGRGVPSGSPRSESSPRWRWRSPTASTITRSVRSPSTPSPPTSSPAWRSSRCSAPADRTRSTACDRATTTGTLRRLGRADRRSGRAGRLHRAAVLAPGLLLDHVLHPGRCRRVEVGPAPARPRAAEGLPRPRLQPDRARRRDVDGPGRHDVGDDPRSRPELIDHVADDLRGVRPRRHRFRQEPRHVALRSRPSRRGARPPSEALLGQDVHGRLDAEHRTAAAVLRPRRLDQRRGESRCASRSALASSSAGCAGTPRRAWCRPRELVQLDVRRPAPRRPRHEPTRASAVPIGPVGPRPTSARRSRHPRSTSGSRSRSAGWAPWDSSRGS